ncbi:methylated-DNA--[protein]-cysteine S-methyltransferase [Poseidonibacter lekithochrous]|uniref:methylated-DNA--[protein]-cysteine S-methyltransferase n=1 Tax=Poseidonibacter TaxID=2321187 RepID=UPI001C0A07C4|nr:MULTISPECIES: methylated-DNA--[protein]-cysteine S-methyltransferase [Poseidonibacter]MBU3015253.1 methylated-DNA--[protein]-cysteine S-methyltransferase [Poseidonibacter lekithochrous]MDO6828551.1 methylated-DNA--[protein]-cysteine S-methyltransferase [Poseidonibacter sp. 1_MG-2023]
MREYKSQSKEIILTTTIDTPLGQMFAAASKKGIVMLCFFTPFNIEARIDTLKKSFDTDIIPSECEYFDTLRTQLEEYFNKQRTSFELPMQLVGSTFQIQVWKELLNIPYGKRESFSSLASKIDGLKSKKALESPLAQNMLNIIVPCHRIKKDDGSLNVYAGGEEKKEFLLKLESAAK